jgi:hypothetical protein
MKGVLMKGILRGLQSNKKAKRMETFYTNIVDKARNIIWGASATKPSTPCEEKLHVTVFLSRH